MSTSISSLFEDRNRPRQRFEIVQQMRAAESGIATQSAPRSTTHGTFVSRARVPATGPATPKLAASISAAAVDVSRRNCRRQRAEIGKVERAI